MDREKRRMLLFFGTVVLFNLAANFAHPITPTVIKNLQLNDYMFGVALAAMTTTNFLFSPFWGKINGYISSRTSMLICCIGYGVGQILFGLARTEGMIILARLFAGCFTGGIFVSFLTYIVNVSPEEDRATNLTISATIQSVASAFGYLVGGFLGVVSIGLTFAVQAATLILAGVLFYFVCRDDAKGSLKEISPKNLVREANPFSAFVASREFMTVIFAVLFAINALQNLGYTAYDQCFNYYIKDQFGFSSAYNGVIKAVVGFISLIANGTICMWIINKTKVERSIVLVLAGCCASVTGIILFNEIAPFMVINIFFFAFSAVSIPVIQSMIASRASGPQSNLVMGFYNATKSLGGIIGSLTAGLIYAKGPKLSFVFSLAALGLAVVLSAGYAKFGVKRA